MFKLIMDKIKPACMLLLLFSLILGFVYPLMITGVGQLLFPWQAKGSLIAVEDRILGSTLIGQFFSDPKYFWGRVSKTTPFPYNAANSKASNLALSNPALIKSIKQQVEHIQQYTKDNHKIPIDLVTASGSGLDPEISPDAAYYQVTRIAKARNMPERIIEGMIQERLKGRTFGILGEPRVNVLELNLSLDEYPISKGQK